MCQMWKYSPMSAGPNFKTGQRFLTLLRSFFSTFHRRMEMKNDFSFHFWSWRQKSDATFLLEAVDEGSRINKSGKEQKRLGENTHAHTRKHAHTRTHMHAHTLSQCLRWTHIQSSIFSCYLSLSIEHARTHAHTLSDPRTETQWLTRKLRKPAPTLTNSFRRLKHYANGQYCVS